MAEYEMKQQNRQSRASANNELGNKHFRRFVDNRKTSYPPIVQFTGPERNSNEAFPFVDMPLTLLYHFSGEKEVNKHCDKSAFLGWSSIQNLEPMPLQESYLVPRHKASHHYINPFFLKGMLHP